MRDKSIDVGRGLLVVIMVYCHVLQFFADTSLFPVAGVIMEAINLTVFPAFVFYFGETAVLAYLRKPYKAALPGMAKTALRAYAAFVLSGAAFRVLRENKPFGAGTVRRVLMLSDIPGWSEFLIAFAGYALLLMLLFPVFRVLAEKPLYALAAGVLCVVLTFFIPYSKVASVQVALVIGGRQFSYFPLLHYMPFLLAGMVYAQGEDKVRHRILWIAITCTAAGAIRCVIAGGLPGRFPPDWSWLMLSAGHAAAVVLAAKGLCVMAAGRCGKATERVCALFAHMGSRSLYYLLASNLVIFTMAGKGIAPSISRKSILPWTTPIQSPHGAAVWTAILLATLWYVAGLAGRGARKKG